jgi:hypothetical protein
MTPQQMQTIKEQITEVTQNQVQAFPCVIPMSDASYFLGGMSLRDWLAGQAIQGMLANPSLNTVEIEDVVCDAYQYADVMLAERTKPKGKN